MTGTRVFLTGLAGIVVVGATAASVQLWSVRSKQVWVGHLVRPATDWHQRVSDWSGSPLAAMAAIDRIEVHAVSPQVVDIEPESAATIPLGQLSTMDMGAVAEHRRSAAARFRAQAGRALFPTAPTSLPHHAIIATRLLQGDDAQQLARRWQSQTLDCDPRGGFSLCHQPSFALSFYAAQALVLEVELCWSCQEASFSVGEKPRLSCDFAVDTHAAAALRRHLKALFPDFRTEEDLAPDFFHEWR